MAVGTDTDNNQLKMAVEEVPADAAAETLVAMVKTTATGTVMMT